MNINYEAIIASASARAEKLKELQAYATDAEDHAKNLLAGLLYFSALNTKVMALDAEGRTLLGGVNGRAQHIGNYVDDVYRLLTSNDSMGSNMRNLMALVEALK